jgi:hypothetical protein
MKIKTVKQEQCVYGGLDTTGGEGEGRRYGEGMWLMDFTYLYKTELKNLRNCFKWGGEGAEGER